MPTPVLMHAAEVIDVKTAAAIARRSDKSIRGSVTRTGQPGRQKLGAPLEISRVGLEMALRGDLDAIQLLRAGRRSDPVVRRYLDHLEISA